jgi:hypothetical protein
MKLQSLEEYSICRNEKFKFYLLFDKYVLKLPRCYGIVVTILAVFVFLKEFLFVAKVAIIIPRKTLAKYGYKSERKYKPLIILLYFWLHIENQI